MNNTALRIYTTVIALICGGAVAWSIHQSSITTAWQADARSWDVLAAQAVAHDRMTTRTMHHLIVRYDQLVIRTRRSQRKLLITIKKAEAGTAAAAVPTSSYSTALPPSLSAPAPVAVAPAPAPAPAPTTHTSPAP